MVSSDGGPDADEFAEEFAPEAPSAHIEEVYENQASDHQQAHDHQQVMIINNLNQNYLNNHNL
eukprot:7454548-Prorocentrum_lima.AAC.1